MKPNRDYQASNIATAYGVRTSHVSHFLKQAVEQGLVDEVLTNKKRGRCYRLVWSEPEVEQPVVEPVYRNLRLDEDLIGYDRQLRSFGELCMATRRS